MRDLINAVPACHHPLQDKLRSGVTKLTPARRPQPKGDARPADTNAPTEQSGTAIGGAGRIIC